MFRLKRHIVTEVIEIFLAVIVALILIMVSFQFAKLLSEAASGKIVGAAIYQLVALQTVKLFVLLTPFAFFIAMLVGLSKLATDNELIAMRSVGHSDWQTYKALFFVGIPLAALMLFMTLYVLPKVLSLNYQLLEKAREQSELSLIQPGQFRHIGGSATVFVADVDDASFSRFFVWQKTQNNESISLAKTGRQYAKEQQRFIELENGSRYTEEKNGSVQIIAFEKLTAQLPSAEPTNRRARLKARSTKELRATPTVEHRVELQRRISTAVSILLLVICAPLLVQFNPRENRYGKFVIAILIYAIYANSQHVLQALIEDGKLPIFPGVYIVHMLFLVVLLLWIWVRFMKVRALHASSLKVEADSGAHND